MQTEVGSKVFQTFQSLTSCWKATLQAKASWKIKNS